MSKPKMIRSISQARPHFARWKQLERELEKIEADRAEAIMAARRTGDEASVDAAHQQADAAAAPLVEERTALYRLIQPWLVDLVNEVVE